MFGKKKTEIGGDEDPMVARHESSADLSVEVAHRKGEHGEGPGQLNRMASKKELKHAHEAERGNAKKSASTVWWKLNDLDGEALVQEEANGEKKEETEKMPFLIFHPVSKFRVAWDLIVLVFLVYFVFAVPLRMCMIDTQFADKTREDCEGFMRDIFTSTDGDLMCFPVKGCQVAFMDLETNTCNYEVASLDWPFIIWNTAIDCFFLIDILVNFRTAYYQSSADISATNL